MIGHQKPAQSDHLAEELVSEMRVAVVGAGVSGLAAAQELAASGGARVTVYEKEDWLGGCARTVAVDDGAGAGLIHLDLCPMVFNQVCSSFILH